MKLFQPAIDTKPFRRAPGQFQQTFLTPLENLNPFVSTILSAAEPFARCSLTIDSMVFESEHLFPLLETHGMPAPAKWYDFTLEITGRQEAEAVLLAVFQDWTDFVLIPSPKSFAIYADHDEFTTFFAHRKSNLNRVVGPLVSAGFKVMDYQRNL